MEKVIWNVVLILLLSLIAWSQYDQGRKNKVAKDVSNVSPKIPLTVLFAQCVYFVKGIVYDDWGLWLGAIIVNSGAGYNLFQWFKTRGRIILKGDLK